MTPKQDPTDTELVEVLTESARRGFLGPGPIEAHLVHAQGFAHGLPVGNPVRTVRLLDLGSGGGLPGLPLFVWRTDLHGVLLDGMERRTRFLVEAVADLGLEDRVTVRTVRAEAAIYDPELLGGFDVVTARSFGPPSATVELAAHFVRLNGIVLVSEPPGGRQWDRDGVISLGLEQTSEHGASIVCFRCVGPPPLPRRWKQLLGKPAIAVSTLGN